MIKTKEEIHNKRPTSPHLSIYKPQISSVLSILHRITGIGLFFAVSILTWGFIATIFQLPMIMIIEKYYVIKLCLVAISFAWFYHLCNGIRHLFWDGGYGFSIRAVNITGWIVVVCSFLLTIILWI